jgi:hypothetical protein
MINKYYYLVASLPYLYFARTCPITTEAFLAECKKWLSEYDMETLSNASIKTHNAKPDAALAVKQWREFDGALREEIAAVRKNTQEKRNDKPGLSARMVFEQPHPLLMEQAFEKIRWQFLDSLEAGNFFDINFLVVYFLKLQIMERLAMFDKKTGEKVFQDMNEVEYA